MQITISIDDKLYDVIQRLARRQDASPTDVIARYVAGIGETEACPRSPVGLFADEAGLMDAIVQDAMQSRERDPLRTP